jgi:hypothetical protein
VQLVDRQKNSAVTADVTSVTPDASEPVVLNGVDCPWTLTLQEIGTSVRGHRSILLEGFGQFQIYP